MARDQPSSPPPESSDSGPPPPPASAVSRREAFLSVLWVLPFALALAELASFSLTQSRVVPLSDWQEAAELVRFGADGHEGFRDGDLIVSAPDWTDQVMRQVLGDLLTLSDAARSDLAPYERVWVLSIRGHQPEELDVSTPPAVDVWRGRVRVRRWDLGPSPVVFDFVEHLEEAEVEIDRDGVPTSCPWRRTGFPHGGGINQGAMTPSERFVCPSHSWLWVGRTIMEDLDLDLHHCVWQHPQGRDAIRTTFRRAPLGDRLVLHGGIYYGHEHPMTGGPVSATVKIDGQVAGRLTHNDGDGWMRMELDTSGLGQDGRGDVSIEVTAPDPHLRTFCWTASTRAGLRSEDREGVR